MPPPRLAELRDEVETGLLAADTRLAGVVRLGALLLLWASVAAAAWMAWRMSRETEAYPP